MLEAFNEIVKKLSSRKPTSHIEIIKEEFSSFYSNFYLKLEDIKKTKDLEWESNKENSLSKENGA